MIDTCTYNRLLGDKSPFSQQSLQGDALDRDEETARIQCKSFHSLCFENSKLAGWYPDIQAFFVKCD